MCFFFFLKIIGKRFQNILKNIGKNISTSLAFYSQSSNSAHNIAFFLKKKKKKERNYQCFLIYFSSIPVL